MTTIRRRRDRTFTAVPIDEIENARLSLPAIGLYVWLAGEERTFEEARARFGITRTQIVFLVEELSRHGFIVTEESGS